MWNYSFTAPSLMILCIILCYYLFRPRLPVRMNRTFLLLLAADILTIVFDYTATRVDEAYLEHTTAEGWLLNMAFFVCFLARIYLFARFTMDVLETYAPLPRWIRGTAPLVLLFCEAAALSSFFTGAVFSYDAGGYHRGYLYNLLYLCFAFYLILSVALVLSRVGRISKYEALSLLCCHGVLLLGNIVRILLPRYLVMNTFCLMAILILFLSFENPDLYLSDWGSAYNARAFRTLLNQWHGRRSYRVLGIAIRRYYEYRGIWGGRKMDQAINGINRYLTDAYSWGLVFYLRNGRFAVVGPGTMDMKAMREKIDARFRWTWEKGEESLPLVPAFAEAEPGEYSADQTINSLVLALDAAGQAAAGEEPRPDSLHAIDRQLEVRRALDKALRDHALEVFLQPIVDGRTGQMVAAEALARLRDETGRLIPPNDFIPLAEGDGRIIQLGEEVFETVCRFLRENRMGSLSWINVNLSPRQCMRKDLPQRFGSIREQYGVPAQRIHLELTEQFMADYSLLKTQVLALQEQGYQFSLDDYGSGFSNLTRVRQYPFQNIKLDMEVVWNYCGDPDPLLPALVQGFKKMGFSVTAEGIETEEMGRIMTEIGCDYLQGYHFSRPLPMEEFLLKYAG